VAQQGSNVEQAHQALLGLSPDGTCDVDTFPGFPNNPASDTLTCLHDFEAIERAAKALAQGLTSLGSPPAEVAALVQRTIKDADNVVATKVLPKDAKNEAQLVDDINGWTPYGA
jgi:hypothetical protein